MARQWTGCHFAGKSSCWNFGVHGAHSVPDKILCLMRFIANTGIAVSKQSPACKRASTFARRFFTSAVENELLLRPIGRTVYLMPPYVLDAELAAWLARAVRRTLADLFPESDVA